MFLSRVVQSGDLICFTNSLVYHCSRCTRYQLEHMVVPSTQTVHYCGRNTHMHLISLHSLCRGSYGMLLISVFPSQKRAATPPLSEGCDPIVTLCFRISADFARHNDMFFACAGGVLNCSLNRSLVSGWVHSCPTDHIRGQNYYATLVQNLYAMDELGEHST